MPNYDWLCKKCKFTFERMVPTSDTKVICPKCSKKCNKLISNPHIMISGQQAVCDDWDPFDKTMIRKGDATHADYRNTAITSLRKKGVPDV